MAIALVTGFGQFIGVDGGTTASEDTTGANLLTMPLYSFAGGSGEGIISDSKSNSWANRTTYMSEGFPRITMYDVVGTPTVGTSHSFTNTSIGIYPSLFPFAWSGAADDPFDQESGNTGSSGVSAQPGSLTPSVNGCLLIATLYVDGALGAVTPPSGWDYIVDESTIRYMAWLIQGTAAAVNPLWEWENSFRWVTSLTVYKPAESGGGGNPWYAYAQQRHKTALSRRWTRPDRIWTPSYARAA